MATRSTKMSGQKERRSWGSRANPPLSAMGSPVGSDDERLDAKTILVAELQGRSQHASEAQVKSLLKEEADTVASKPENSLVYANGRGFGILEKLESFMKTMENQSLELKKQALELEKLKSEARVSKNRIEALESEGRESKTKSDTQEHNLLALQGRVTNLTSISQGYLDIRMRFLDNYNKKVKRDPAFQQTAAIEIGNQRAHGGDANVDALLFREQKRLQDPETYKELYGVDHSKALEYAEPKGDGKIQERVFLVLNARATQVAQKRPFSPELEKAFKLYISLLDKEGVGKAYYAFWKIHNKEYPLSQ